jgi:carboxyl-terminal processing protease
MKPGEQRQVEFTFDVRDNLSENFASLDISVADRDLRVLASEKVKIPVVKTPLAVQKAEGKAQVHGLGLVRGQPLGAAPVVGELERGSVVEKLGSFGPFTKVSLGNGRFGFVETQVLREGAGPAKLAFKPQLTHSPPLLEVLPAKLATSDTKVRIEGKATDSDRVQDVFIFVGPRKVFYQSNRKAADNKTLKFNLDAELQPGINVITVVARESEDSATRHTMVVRRDGPGGEALPTPKVDQLFDTLDLEGMDD